jgi:hypothetical protein
MIAVEYGRIFSPSGNADRLPIEVSSPESARRSGNDLARLYTGRPEFKSIISGIRSAKTCHSIPNVNPTQVRYPPQTAC